jgi:WD40 repeat protein
MLGMVDIAGVTSLAFDGEFLFSGSHDTKIKVWNRNYEVIQELEGHKFTVWAVTATKDTLFSGAADGTIREWSRVKKDSMVMMEAGAIMKNPLGGKTYCLAASGNRLFSGTYKSLLVRVASRSLASRTLCSSSSSTCLLGLGSDVQGSYSHCCGA